MPLVFGDESTTSYVKFNAKEGRWKANDATGEVGDIETPRLLIDLDHLQTGWFCFREAQAPDIVLDEKAEQAPEPEGGQHKRGFRVSVYSTALGLREFTSSSLMLKRAMKALFTVWEEDKDVHPGQVPLVIVTEHRPVVGQYGTNYEPVFVIESWHDRPECLRGPDTTNVTTLPTAQPSTPSADVLPDDNIPF